KPGNGVGCVHAVVHEAHAAPRANAWRSQCRGSRQAGNRIALPRLIRTLETIMPVNRQVLLKSRPTGMPAPDNFEVVERPVPEPGEGQVLVRNQFLSVDPYMRGRMSDAKSYATPVAVGGVMGGGTVGTV